MRHKNSLENGKCQSFTHSLTQQMRMKEDQNSIQIGTHTHTLADIHFFHIKKRTKNYNLPLEFANTNEYDEMRLEQKISFSNPSVGVFCAVWEMRCLKSIIVYVYRVCVCVYCALVGSCLKLLKWKLKSSNSWKLKYHTAVNAVHVPALSIGNICDFIWKIHLELVFYPTQPIIINLSVHCAMCTMPWWHDASAIFYYYSSIFSRGSLNQIRGYSVLC